MLSFWGFGSRYDRRARGHARHKRTWAIRPADRDRLRINPEPALNQGSVRLLAPLAADRAVLDCSLGSRMALSVVVARSSEKRVAPPSTLLRARSLRLRAV